MKKRIFDQLNWLNDEGPFITIVSPATFVATEMNKDRLHFKNLIRDVRDKFKEKYPNVNYDPYESALNDFYEDRSLWSGGAQSLLFVINKTKSDVISLGIEVSPYSYVASVPYIIPLIQDIQFLTHFYLLTLNRDSFKLFEVRDRSLHEVNLPEDAPSTLEDALGSDVSVSGFPHGSGRVVQGDNRGYYGGVSATRDERSVDRVNYFYAVDRFLSESEVLEHNLPIELFALPENRSVYLDLSKLINLDRDMGILSSPEDFNSSKILEETLTAIEMKNKRTIAHLFDTLDRYKAAGRVQNDASKISELSEYGAVSSLYITKERLDRDDYQTNEIAINVLNSGGDVYVLNHDSRLGPDKMTALLRFTV